MAIAWDPNLAIGVETIDAQHQELFRRIDRLLEAAHKRTTSAEVGLLLDFLSEYARIHFAEEEHLMAAKAYPELAAHQAEHQTFVKQFAILRAEYEKEGGTPLLVIRVSNRATSWLREHIYRADKAFGRFLSGPTW